MDVAVRTVNLRKTYLSRGSRRVAVTGLSMAVPLGGRPRLPRPERLAARRRRSGCCSASCAPTPAPPRSSARRCPSGCPTSSTGSGAIVESPKFFPAFTARQNLVLLAERDRQPAPPRRRGPRGDAPRRPRSRPVCRLLPRHEAAPRHRGDAAQGPRPAHLRRADQRARPRRASARCATRCDRLAHRARRCSSAHTSSPRSSRSPTPCRSSGTGRCSPRARVSDILGGAGRRHRAGARRRRLPRPGRRGAARPTASP